MAETVTPHFGWTKPDIGGDASTWGNVLNTTIDAVDSVVYANQNAGVPIGSMTMWAGPTTSPPNNWLICDGRTLDYGATPAYQGLFNVIGRAFNTALTGTQFALPNLVQNFPIGAGANVLGAVGGTFSYILATANLPPHNHPASQDAHNHAITTGSHAHGIATGGHSHAIHTGGHSHGLDHQVLTPNAGGNASAGAGWGFNTVNTGAVGDLGGSTDAAGNLGGNTDTAGNLGGSTDTRTPNVYTGNTGSATPLSIVPPFIAINFIIRYL